MENLPIYISIVFVLTTALTAYFFWRSVHWSPWVIGASVCWLGAQALLGFLGFYEVVDTIPPRMLLALMPTLVAMTILFASKKGRIWIDSLDLRLFTLLHIVRIPVELVLFWLSLEMVVPQLMTFEGRNFDIFSGITAPIVWYFGLVLGKFKRGIVVAWNLVCLGLLVNIVVHAILALPTPLQQIAFDQPNIAVMHFPFIWLPSFVVPVVLFAHLVVIRQLLLRRQQ